VAWQQSFDPLVQRGAVAWLNRVCYLCLWRYRCDSSSLGHHRRQRGLLQNHLHHLWIHYFALRFFFRVLPLRILWQFQSWWTLNHRLSAGWQQVLLDHQDTFLFQPYRFLYTGDLPCKYGCRWLALFWLAKNKKALDVQKRHTSFAYSLHDCAGFVCLQQTAWVSIDCGLSHVHSYCIYPPRAVSLQSMRNHSAAEKNWHGDRRIFVLHLGVLHSLRSRSMVRYLS